MSKRTKPANPLVAIAQIAFMALLVMTPGKEEFRENLIVSAAGKKTRGAEVAKIF